MLSAEIEAMRSAVKKGKSRHAHRDSTLILLIYRHGLRVAEASALQWTQIDFNGGTIYVKRVKKGTPSVQPLYGDEIRSLRKLQRDYPPSPCVFQSSRSGPLAHDTVGGIVERAGELAALQMPVHAHMLRHSTGYYLANRGIDTRTIQSYLGHNNIQHTVRYRGTTTIRAKLYHDRLKTSVQQCFGRSISLMGMNHFTALIDGLIERFISKYCGWSI